MVTLTAKKSLEIFGIYWEKKLILKTKLEVFTAIFASGKKGWEAYNGIPHSSLIIRNKFSIHRSPASVTT